MTRRYLVDSGFSVKPQAWPSAWLRSQGLGSPAVGSGQVLRALAWKLRDRYPEVPEVEQEKIAHAEPRLPRPGKAAEV